MRRLLCFFGIHKWEYSQEEIEAPAVTWISKVRGCPRCLKVQAMVYNGRWWDCTLEEEKK